MIKLKDILLEGGNLFADAVGIKQSEVMPTVKKIETDILKPLGLIGFGTDCFILGSAGKKPADQLSGDLDIGISMDQIASANSLKLSDVLNWVSDKLSAMGYETQPLRGFSQISIPYEIVGRNTGEPVQVDFMLSNNLNWTQFVYSSPDYSKGESKYKSAYRNFLLGAVVAAFDYKVLKKTDKDVPIEIQKYVMRHDKGIFNLIKNYSGKGGGVIKSGKTIAGSESFLTQTPEEMVNFFLGDQYSPTDISSFEKLHDVVFNKPSKVSGMRELIRKFFIQNITDAKLPIPEIV
jgi:hypothetical protein